MVKDRIDALEDFRKQLEGADVKNMIFCASIDTDVNYSPNGVTGNANGWVDGWFHDSTASGGCTSLMHFACYHTLIRNAA